MMRPGRPERCVPPTVTVTVAVNYVRGVVMYVYDMYVCMCVCVSHPHGVVSDALVRASEDRRLDLEQRVRGR